jgi:predicted MFS family arabinose efflux permease
MLVCFMLCCVGLVALPFAIETKFVWPLLLALGASGFGIYTVGLAQLGDRFTGPDLIAGTSAFSTVWGLGALTGSVACGLAMDQRGPNGFPEALLAAFLLYLVIRLVVRITRGAPKA